MARHATGTRRRPSRPLLVAWIAVAGAYAGVFTAWTTDGPVALDGVQGPHDGWLVAIVAAFALGWTRSLARGSWIAVAGVLGSAVVIAWTALGSWLDGRAVTGASIGPGALLVIAAGVALVGAAVASGVERARR